MEDIRVFKELLQKLSIPADDILKFERGDMKIDDMFEAIRTEQKKILNNDSSFVSHWKTEGANEATNKLKEEIKKTFSIKEEDIADRPLHLVLESFHITKLNEQRADYTQKSDNKLAEEISKYREGLAAKDAELDRIRRDEIPAIKAIAEREVTQTRIALLLERYIEKFELTSSAAFIYPSVIKAIAEKGWKLEIVGSNKLEIKTLEGHTPYQTDNKTFVELDYFLSELFKSQKMLKVSNAVNVNDNSNVSNTFNNNNRNRITTHDITSDNSFQKKSTTNGLPGLAVIEKQKPRIQYK
jgi:hypothetical protein